MEEFGDLSGAEVDALIPRIAATEKTSDLVKAALAQPGRQGEELDIARRSHKALCALLASAVAQNRRLLKQTDKLEAACAALAGLTELAKAQSEYIKGEQERAAAREKQGKARERIEARRLREDLESRLNRKTSTADLEMLAQIGRASRSGADALESAKRKLSEPFAGEWAPAGAGLLLDALDGLDKIESKLGPVWSAGAKRKPQG